MKKWQILVPGLVAAVSAPIVSLTACNDPDHPVEKVTFELEPGTITSTGKSATIKVNWTPGEHKIKFGTGATFFYGEKIECKVEVKDPTSWSRPQEFIVTFPKAITGNITNGCLNFEYQDETTHGSLSEGMIENIYIQYQINHSNKKEH